MGLKTFNILLTEISKDSHLRNDEKYHSFLFSSDWNLFSSKSKKLIPLKEILFDDYTLFDYQEDNEYKGIPTGQTYIDEDGDIKDYQLVTADNHPGRLKYKISNNNILISSLRLARSPALYFENIDLSRHVFSNGFYVFKVKEGWNNKFILYVLRTNKLKNILDNHIYRGIGISAYKKEDLLKIKIPVIPKADQDLIVAQIEPIEKNITSLKTQIKQPQEIINKIF
jgi:type I restriction enzyme S subunit